MLLAFKYGIVGVTSILALAFGTKVVEKSDNFAQYALIGGAMYLGGRYLKLI